ncbi:MAG: glycine cleavage system protein GcvH [Planctomycetota bacterium]
MKPEELLYAKSHEWAHVAEQDGAKIATIGISAFAIEQLNDLVYMELPEVGRAVEAGESFGEIESVKAVSDVYAPVAGEIVEVNSEIVDNLESLLDNAYTSGWLIKIKVSDEAGLGNLMSHEDYAKQCAAEG